MGVLEADNLLRVDADLFDSLWAASSIDLDKSADTGTSDIDAMLG